LAEIFEDTENPLETINKISALEGETFFNGAHVIFAKEYNSTLAKLKKGLELQDNVQLYSLTGSWAPALARRLVHSIVLTSVNSGNDVVRVLTLMNELKKELENKTVKVVVVSRYNNPGIIKKFQNFGCTDYIAEPIADKDLIAKINESINFSITERKEFVQPERFPEHTLTSTMDDHVTERARPMLALSSALTSTMDDHVTESNAQTSEQVLQLNAHSRNFLKQDQTSGGKQFEFLKDENIMLIKKAIPLGSSALTTAIYISELLLITKGNWLQTFQSICVFLKEVLSVPSVSVLLLNQEHKNLEDFEVLASTQAPVISHQLLERALASNEPYYDQQGSGGIYCFIEPAGLLLVEPQDEKQSLLASVKYLKGVAYCLRGVLLEAIKTRGGTFREAA